MVFELWWCVTKECLGQIGDKICYLPWAAGEVGGEWKQKNMTSPPPLPLRPWGSFQFWFSSTASTNKLSWIWKLSLIVSGITLLLFHSLIIHPKTFFLSSIQLWDARIRKGYQWQTCIDVGFNNLIENSRYHESDNSWQEGVSCWHIVYGWWYVKVHHFYGWDSKIRPLIIYWCSSRFV